MKSSILFVHFQWYRDIPSHEKAFPKPIHSLFLFYQVANKSDDHRRKLSAKTQNGSPRITDFQ